ncbi:MAG: glycosyltransferase family 4 protein [Candidatus Zixiibacteriota bacterium]
MSAAHPDTPSVVIVNDFAHVNGGAAMVALESAKGLAAREWNVTLFAAVLPIDEALEKAGVRVVCTDQHEIRTDPNRKRAVRQGIWNTIAAERLAEVLRDKNPKTTIVHVHGWTKSLSSSVIRVAVDAGCPVACTLHDYFAACPNGGFYDYRKNKICTRRAMSLDCILTNCDKQGYGQKLFRVIRQRKQMRTGQVPSGIRQFISISNFSLEILKSYLPSDARVDFVPNPIFVAKAEPATPENNDTLLCIARLSPEKGIGLLAEAARTTGAKLKVVGDGELKQLLQREYPEVEFTGWQNREQVNAHFRSARVLVLPSLWYETQGMVVAEAAALGVPSIVPDTCAARDMVVDGKTGLWFTGGDVSDLAEKIAILKDSATVQAMGQAAYSSFWVNPPTIDRHLDALESVYRHML